MIIRTASHCNDDTCPACVVAGGFIFLSHHTGGHEISDVEFQVRATLTALSRTLQSVNADINDVVQLTLYLKNRSDFSAARRVFREFFAEGNYPARMTVFTEFINDSCLCMMDGVALSKTTPGE